MSNTETSLKARYQNMLIRMRELVPMEDFIFGELFECKRVHSSRIRVPVHTGETQQLRAFIAHHCNPFKTGEDPYKGGLRKSAEVVQDMIEGLSMDMTIKQAIASLPLGGGKAGICLEKGFHYTLQDHARMNKAFVIEFDKVNMLGPRIYSTASDLGTSEFDCDIIAKEYVAALINFGERFFTHLHLKSAGLERKFDFRVFVQVVGPCVMIRQRVGRK